jgi:hypothetical protein
VVKFPRLLGQTPILEHPLVKLFRNSGDIRICLLNLEICPLKQFPKVFNL